MKTFSDIKIILYNEEHLKYKIARRIISAASEFKKKTVIFKSETELGLYINELKPFFESKEVLILKEFLGRKFQKCPGSNNVICCNYYLLNTCFNCLFNCTYCFLNSYLNSFGIVQFVNLDDLSVLINEFTNNYHGIVRIGTGEFTDSLMFDEITGIAEDIISETALNNKAFIEFKTKSANIAHLIDIKNKGNAVLAWTLNTQKNIDLYEDGAASLFQRLSAAREAQDAGFFTAFHFDPIIKYNDFMNAYFEVIEQMKNKILPDKILWISLGCFRYSHGFKDVIKHNFPQEKITTDEMFPGIDGKFRYLRQDRISIYRKIAEKIRTVFPDIFIYLCMEDRTVWYDVFEKEYSFSDDLENDLMVHLKKFILQ